MSIGSSSESLAMKDVLAEAYNTTMIVAAAGNNNLPICPEGISCETIYPAAYSFVVGVEAVKNDLSRASFSNFDPSGPIEYKNPDGHNYELKAPGVGILSTVPKGGYRNLNGTSMATPMVAGAVAIMKSHDNTLSHDEIFARLIQSSSSNGGVLQTKAAIEYDLKPDLYFQNTVVVDTLQTKPGDGDFLVDAGERIGISFFVKNTGAKAENVYVKLKLGEFEDPSVATIVKDSINLGNIGIYGKLGHTEVPLEVDIASDVIHGRSIVLDYEIGATNTTQRVTGSVDIRVTNAEELVGILSDEKTLTADKLWVVNNSFRISQTGILNIEPGTHLILEKQIVNYGTINGIGLPDKRISIKGPAGVNIDLPIPIYPPGILNFENTDFSNMYGDFPLHASKGSFKYCNFNEISAGSVLNINSSLIENQPTIENCTFKNINLVASVNILYGENYIYKCNFDNVNQTLGGNKVEFSNFNRVLNQNRFAVYGYKESVNNNFIGTYNEDGTTKSVLYRLQYPSSLKENISNNYWGTNNEDEIDKFIYDFWDDATLNIINYSPFLEKPSSEAHGIVWKVEINETDILHDNFDPVGAEKLKFQVYFNRPMNPDKVPFLTFGLREPRTQNTVLEEASWNADNTIWTAYHTVNYRTGDGINFIRVSAAEDLEGFEIPVEDNLRFKFNIQTTGALSNNLNATAEIGKVKVDWQTIDEADVLGNNIYRYESYIEDEEVKFTEKVKINNALILDGRYTDEGGDPNIEYYYQITSLDANFSESDYSSSVKASPMGNTASINDVISSQISLYPNPTKEVFYIKTSLVIKNLTIYDVRGNHIKEIKEDKNINISNLSTGIYFLKIETEKGSVTKKIMKE